MAISARAWWWNEWKGRMPAVAASGFVSALAWGGARQLLLQCANDT